jgi:hypothetical protein
MTYEIPALRREQSVVSRCSQYPLKSQGRVRCRIGGRHCASYWAPKGSLKLRQRLQHMQSGVAGHSRSVSPLVSAFNALRLQMQT